MSAGAQAYAPQFSVRSLDGSSISNSSFSGNAVLVQFWATWCPYCRRDQAGIDRIERNYSEEGLTVLAVDVGESPEKVRAYLQANPRACQIALDPDESMAAQFGAHAFPHYVLIDRRGKVAATMHGSGGEEALQRLIERSGVLSNRDRPPTSPPVTAASVRRSSVVEVPFATSAAPSKPLPKTIFVFLNGEQLETDHYLLRPGVLEVVENDQRRRVPLDTLDLKKTISVNHERGINLKIPTAENQMFLAF